MKMISAEQVEDFIKVIDSCEDNVFLLSQYGDRYNLKSKLSQYVAIGELVKNAQNALEIYAVSRADENRIMEFFDQYPETL